MQQTWLQQQLQLRQKHWLQQQPQHNFVAAAVMLALVKQLS